MATGRIGVTPTLRTRWSKQPTAGTTSLSGLDDNSVSLVYDVGYEAVYRNGVLLSRGNDYTATSGTSVTLIDATLAGDIIEILANQLVPLTNAISNGQFTAKGALLSATAASTPGVLAVGANDTVLTADSTASTGLKWATPAAGGMTLLSTTTLSGASVTVSSINQTYNSLYITMEGATNATANGSLQIRPNDNAVANYVGFDGAPTTVTPFSRSSSAIRTNENTLRTSANNYLICEIYNYANSTYNKPIKFYGSYDSDTGGERMMWSGGFTYNDGAITSIKFQNISGSFSTGTVKIYGVK